MAIAEHDPFHDADRAQVAIPALDRVLLDVAVAAEQLHAVAADLHAVLGGEPAGQRGLAGERRPVRPGAAARSITSRMPSSSMPMLATMNATRLPVADRLAERLALVDVGDDVVEHGLARCRTRAPPSRPRGAARTSAYTSRSPPPSSALAGSDTSSSTSRPVAAARSPIAGSASTDTRRARDSTRNSAGPRPSRSAATTNSSAFAARGTSDFTPSSTKPPPSRGAVVFRANGSNSGARSSSASAAAGHVVADERGQVGRLLRARRPS